MIIISDADEIPNPKKIKLFIGKELPVKNEVLIITIDKGEGKTSTLIYKMNRTGMKVNEEGNMIDQVELEVYKENEQLTSGDGRFTGLFKKLVTA